jgi:hypothetical protein
MRAEIENMENNSMPAHATLQERLPTSAVAYLERQAVPGLEPEKVLYVSNSIGEERQFEAMGLKRLLFVSYRAELKERDIAIQFRTAVWSQGTFPEWLRTMAAPVSTMTGVKKRQKYLRAIFAPNRGGVEMFNGVTYMVVPKDDPTAAIYDGGGLIRVSLAAKLLGVRKPASIVGKVLISRALTATHFLKGGWMVVEDSAIPTDIVSYDAKSDFFLPGAKPDQALVWFNSSPEEAFHIQGTDLQSVLNMTSVHSGELFKLFKEYAITFRYLFKKERNELYAQYSKTDLESMGEVPEDGRIRAHAVAYLMEQGIDLGNVPSLLKELFQSIFGKGMDPMKMRIEPIRIVDGRKVFDQVSILPRIAYPHEDESPGLAEDGSVILYCPPSLWKHTTKGSKGYVYRTPNTSASGTIVTLEESTDGTFYWGRQNGEEVFELVYARNEGGDLDDHFHLMLNGLAEIAIERHAEKLKGITFVDGRPQRLSNERMEKAEAWLCAMDAQTPRLGRWNSYLDKNEEVRWVSGLYALIQRGEAISNIMEAEPEDFWSGLSLAVTLDDFTSGMTGVSANWLMVIQAIRAGLVKIPMTPELDAVLAYAESIMLSDIIDAQLKGDNIEKGIRAYRSLICSANYIAAVVKAQKGLKCHPLFVRRFAGELKRITGRRLRRGPNGNLLTEEITVGGKTYSRPLTMNPIVGVKGLQWNLFDIFVDQARWISKTYTDEVQQAGLRLQNAVVGEIRGILAGIPGSSQYANTAKMLGDLLAEPAKVYHEAREFLAADEKGLQTLNSWWTQVKREALRKVLGTDPKERKLRIAYLILSSWEGLKASDFMSLVSDDASLKEIRNAVKSRNTTKGGRADSYIWSSTMNQDELAIFLSSENPDIGLEPWGAAIRLLVRANQNLPAGRQTKTVSVNFKGVTPETHETYGKAMVGSLFGRLAKSDAWFVTDDRESGINVAATSRSKNAAERRTFVLEEYGDWTVETYEVVRIRNASGNIFSFIRFTIAKGENPSGGDEEPESFEGYFEAQDEALMELISAAEEASFEVEEDSMLEPSQMAFDFEVE